ncbi:transposase [Agarilytica rhodophyticola]|uniref:transposase n=1 Tax=Agarilytica rhodophyticola TaxID=1737490 RepID=UPI000B34370A|nr:transposase [Agarilytica rhodophyticola]
MPKPRKQLISLDATPYYHCTSRCVRRAFLCGFDQLTNRSYEHRRKWIEQRIHYLAQVFSIDICAYAVMSNHLHVVLHVNRGKSLDWSNKEVAIRWHKLYKGTELTRKYLHNNYLTASEIHTVKLKLAQWRKQLSDISWFMRALNEPIARQANAEDKCTGKFWESRFKSQALLDEKALIACMAYVDLNPVRSKMAISVKTSDYTSIKLRCKNYIRKTNQPKMLMPFATALSKIKNKVIPFKLTDYISLLEWTKNVIRGNKPHHSPPTILKQLTISPSTWLILSTQFENRFKSLVGMKEKLRITAYQLGFKRSPGLTNCHMLLG